MSKTAIIKVIDAGFKIDKFKKILESAQVQVFQSQQIQLEYAARIFKEQARALEKLEKSVFSPNQTIVEFAHKLSEVRDFRTSINNLTESFSITDSEKIGLSFEEVVKLYVERKIKKQHKQTKLFYRCIRLLIKQKIQPKYTITLASALSELIQLKIISPNSIDEEKTFFNSLSSLKMSLKQIQQYNGSHPHNRRTYKVH